MKCLKDDIDVTADDCENCVSERKSTMWCFYHLVWGATGEPQFSHPFSRFSEGIEYEKRKEREKLKEESSQTSQLITRIIESQELLARRD